MRANEECSIWGGGWGWDPSELDAVLPLKKGKRKGREVN